MAVPLQKRAPNEISPPPLPPLPLWAQFPAEVYYAPILPWILEHAMRNHY